MRRYVCLIALGLVLAVCSSAAAQENPKADVFLGYSYIQANPATSGAPNFHFHGGVGQVSYNVNNWLGAVGDFGGYHVGNIAGTPVDANLFTYMFGPRLNYRRSERFTPFAQALFGGAHVGSGTLQGGSQNAFAVAFGGGLDVHATKHFGLRVGQVEYLMTRFREATPDRQTQNNLRLSTGLLIRF
jgi:hypothetical protein